MTTYREKKRRYFSTVALARVMKAQGNPHEPVSYVVQQQKLVPVSNDSYYTMLFELFTHI